MKILLADDHAILRKGLKLLLAEEFPGAQFGETSNTLETLQSLSQQRWDLLVLDIFMPGRNGLEVLSEAKRHYPDLSILVLSSAPIEQLAVRVMKLGACGYLNKQAAPEELVSAVKRVLKTGKYISAVLAEHLAVEVTQPYFTRYGGLSEREYTVLHLLMAGKSVKGIAAELSLSPKTVSTYHTRIWEKLGVRNDVEMIRSVLQHHLLV